MLKLDLATHRPAFAKVIVEIDHGVRNIKAPVTRILFIFSGIGIAIDIVAKKFTRISRFTITTHAEAIAACVFSHAI